MRFSVTAFLFAGLALAPHVAAQSALSGGVSGQVIAPTLEGLPNAVVTLRSTESSLQRETTTDLRGAYSFAFVAPGSYEVRVEVLGYRPKLVTGLQLDAGAKRSLDVTVVPEPPPVTAVDTVLLEGTADSRWRPSGPGVGTRELTSHRDLLGGAASLSHFASEADPYMGALGLPGDMTGQVVDGVPIFRAQHPLIRGDGQGSPAFPTSSLARAVFQVTPGDIQWLTSAGAVVTADSRAGVDGGGTASAEGAWSGGPLWSSGTLNVTSPELSSFHAIAGATLDLVPDTSRLFVSGEALQQQSPLQPRLPQGLAEAAQGLDPLLLEQLTAPTVETLSRYSGLARLDRVGPTSRFTLRAAGGRLTRDFAGPDAGSLGYGATLPEENTDVSAGLALTSEVSPLLTVEFTGGLSISDRVFGTSESVAPATFVGLGLPLGSAAGGPAESARLDAYLSAAAHAEAGPGSGKVGLTIHATRHTLSQAFGGGGDLFFSDFAGLAAGEGAFMDGTSVESSFATSRVGGFAQYAWEASQGLDVVVGARVDLETVPTQDASLNSDWVTTSGALNNDFPARYVQPAGLFSATWDVRGDNRTVLFGAASVSNGTLDPRLLHEVFSQDGAASVRRYLGSGIGWPEVEVPSTARPTDVLTLLGPDTRPPRSAHFGAGLLQHLGGGWSLQMSATTRRTDFLPRRRDLNLPLFPLATDANGRDVMGDLRKIGSMVIAEPGKARRFEDFDAVFALDPDGWSRYKGATVGLGHTSRRGDAFLSYTWSETRDNWVGAARGLPDAQMDPGLPESQGTTWAEGLSDFDTPNRLVAGARLRLDVAEGAEISAMYSYRSGRPFTPGYRTGVDANGDGSARNDVAWVPDVGDLTEVLGRWSCLAGQTEGFAVRNSCRGPVQKSLNASVVVGLAALGGRTVSLMVEGFNLIEDGSGLLDEALLLVDPDAPLVRSDDGASLTIPVLVNPDFGNVVVPSTRGRVLRIGLRIGG